VVAGAHESAGGDHRACRLRFPDPTNLGKFFTGRIGTWPGAFRHIHQGQ
jgi:hypothetical protein